MTDLSGPEVQLDRMNPSNEFADCRPECSGKWRWLLIAIGVRRVGCYECRWCDQVYPVI